MVRRANNTEERLSKLHEGNQKFLNDSNKKSEMIKRVKESLSDLEYKQKRSKISKFYWDSNEDFQKRFLEKRDEFWTDKESDKYKEHCKQKSIRQKNIMQKIENKKRVKEYWNNDINKKNISNRISCMRVINNGILEAVTDIEKLPSGWIEGRLYKSKPKDWKWYNNGLFNVRYKECPEGFKPGKLTYYKKRQLREKVEIHKCIK